MHITRKTDDALYNALTDKNTLMVELDTADPDVKVYIHKPGKDAFKVSNSSDPNKGGTVVHSIESAMVTARGRYYSATE